jgi:hypothetical protein
MENEKSLMQYLEDINGCKENIREQLIVKGLTSIENAKFTEFADKIESWVIDSGNTQPEQSADYIYSNGYLTNGTETNEIIIFNKYKIELDGDTCVFYLTCQPEYPLYFGEPPYYDIVFTVDIPTSYVIDSFKIYDEQSTEKDEEGYAPHDHKPNPRYSTIIRDGKEYDSFVRLVNPRDYDDNFGSDYVKITEAKYKITIRKNDTSI